MPEHGETPRNEGSFMPFETLIDVTALRDLLESGKPVLVLDC